MFHIPPSVKAVLFDLNGTLIRDGAVHFSAFQEVLTEEGIAITPEEFETKVANSLNRLIWPTLLRRNLSETELADLSARKEQRYLELLPSIGRPTEGIFALLDALRSRNIQTALVTTTPRYIAEKVLDLLELSGEFEMRICGEEVKKGKPDPEIYMLTLAKLGVTAETALAFEDSPKGVLSARAAGIRVVGVLPEYPAELLIKNGAEQCVKDFTEVVLKY